MRAWLLLAAVTFLPRVVMAFFLGVWGDPERWEYDVIAANIHAGAGHVYNRGGFVYTAYAPPLWSYILAALLGLPGVTRASVQILQALFCFGTATACAALARRLGGSDTAAMVTGLFVALQPSLLYYSVVKSDPLPLNALLLSLIALASADLIDKPGQVRAAGAGILIALATLSRGTPAIALPLVALLLLLRFGRKAVKPILIMGLAMFLGLAPWLVRNTMVFGEPLITTTTGENFWRGNNERATGGVLDPAGRSLTRLSPTGDVFSPAIRAVLANGAEVDRQHVFMAEAGRFIGAHPFEAGGLFARKMRAFWWRIESNPGDYDPASARLYEWIYRIELGLAMVGGGVLLRMPRTGGATAVLDTAALLAGLMIGISILQSAFYVQGRHRFLIEPLLLIFSARGLTAIRTAFLAGGRRE